MNCTATDKQIDELKDSAFQIESALAALVRAETQAGKITVKIAEEESQIAAALAGLDATDEPAVDALAVRRTRAETMRVWLTQNPSLRVALDELATALQAAKPLITATAQRRSVEEGVISMCAWANEFAGMFQMDTASKKHFLRSTSHQVLADISTILRGRIGALLRAEERRSGVFENGTNRRQLTPEEIQQGFANE